MSEYMLIATADGVNRASAVSNSGGVTEDAESTGGWSGQLAVPVHCVVLGETPEPPSGWPLVGCKGKSFTAAVPAIAAATSGRVQWVDVQGLIGALDPLSTKALETSAEKYEREAEEAKRLRDDYTVALRGVIQCRWQKVGAANRIVDQFKWIPERAIEAAADALEEDGDNGRSTSAGDDDDKVNTKKKKKRRKKGKKGKNDDDWMKEWAAGGKEYGKWKGYGSHVYYQPRSKWPPLPREARRLAKERNENAAGPDRFRPWDGDTLPWEPPMSALSAPMRDLTLINQPPWRPNSASGDPTIHLDRAPPPNQPQRRQQDPPWMKPRRPRSAAPLGEAGYLGHEAWVPSGAPARHDGWSPPRTKSPPSIRPTPPPRGLPRWGAKNVLLTQSLKARGFKN